MPEYTFRELTGYHSGSDFYGRFELSIHGVKVRRAVVAVVHRDHNPKKA
jgi:hypothetical protein